MNPRDFCFLNSSSRCYRDMADSSNANAAAQGENMGAAQPPAPVSDAQQPPAPPSNAPTSDTNIQRDAGSNEPIPQRLEGPAALYFLVHGDNTNLLALSNDYGVWGAGPQSCRDVMNAASQTSPRTNVIFIFSIPSVKNVYGYAIVNSVPVPRGQVLPVGSKGDQDAPRDESWAVVVRVAWVTLATVPHAELLHAFGSDTGAESLFGNAVCPSFSSVGTPLGAAICNLVDSAARKRLPRDLGARPPRDREPRDYHNRDIREYNREPRDYANRDRREYHSREPRSEYSSREPRDYNDRRDQYRTQPEAPLPPQAVSAPLYPPMMMPPGFAPPPGMPMPPIDPAAAAPIQGPEYEAYMRYAQVYAAMQSAAMAAWMAQQQQQQQGSHAAPSASQAPPPYSS